MEHCPFAAWDESFASGLAPDVALGSEGVAASKVSKVSKRKEQENQQMQPGIQRVPEVKLQK